MSRGPSFEMNKNADAGTSPVPEKADSVPVLSYDKMLCDTGSVPLPAWAVAGWPSRLPVQGPVVHNGESGIWKQDQSVTT